MSRPHFLNTVYYLCVILIESYMYIICYEVAKYLHLSKVLYFQYQQQITQFILITKIRNVQRFTVINTDTFKCREQ